MKNTAIVQITNPIELVQIGEKLGNAWFRGQGSIKWKLQSTLERDGEKFGVPRNRLFEREKEMLDLFKQRAHLFDSKFVTPKSTLEWEALIQHYGGPSRLLDITSSYLVATFFALISSPNTEDKTDKDDAVVWVFRNLDDFKNGVDAEDIEGMFKLDNDQQKVIVAQPGQLNIRINAQSAGFLIPSSVEESMETLISKTYNTNLGDGNEDKKTIPDVMGLPLIKHQIWKLVIPHENQAELFRFLSRCNVRAYSLFPDIEGLATSLKEMMRAYS